MAGEILCNIGWLDVLWIGKSWNFKNSYCNKLVKELIFFKGVKELVKNTCYFPFKKKKKYLLLYIYMYISYPKIITLFCIYK